MALTAQRITKSDSLGISPPTLSGRGGESVRARETYIVQTASIAEAAAALGLPTYGDPFPDTPAGIVGLVCRSIDYSIHSGEPSQTPGGIGGVVVVDVGYETPTGSGGGSNPQPSPGVTYSEIGSGSASVQRISSGQVNPSLVGPPEPPWNNGRGVTVEIGYLTFRVVSYAPIALFEAEIQRITRLNNGRKVNSDTVSIPPLVATGGNGLIFAPGQLRFGGFSVEPVPGEGSLVKITYLFDAAEDFKARWQEEDEHGQPVGPVIEKPAYDAEPFTGLP